MNDSQQGLTVGATLQLLSHPQRRQIIDQVADTAHVTTVDQLSKRSAQTDRLSSNRDDHAETGAIGLHHVHLPKLHEAGVIVYDPDRQTVRPGRHFEAVLDLLTLVEEYCETSSTLTA